MTRADSVHSTPPLNTSALTPIPGLDWLDIREDTPPAEIFRAIGRLRKEARDEIDRLIRFLDESDNHMELEPDDESDDSEQEDDDPAEDDGTSEWSLGFLERHPSIYGYGRDGSGTQERLCQGYGGDREDEHNGAEPTEDEEPSLGSSHCHHNQRHWSIGSHYDGELDDCDRESDEPLLTECSGGGA